VAAIPMNLLKARGVADFTQLFPKHFNDKANGVT
jgi:hypothetical protein